MCFLCLFLKSSRSLAIYHLNYMCMFKKSNQWPHKIHTPHSTPPLPNPFPRSFNHVVIYTYLNPKNHWTQDLNLDPTRWWLNHSRASVKCNCMSGPPVPSWLVTISWTIVTLSTTIMPLLLQRPKLCIVHTKLSHQLNAKHEWTWTTKFTATSSPRRLKPSYMMLGGVVKEQVTHASSPSTLNWSTSLQYKEFVWLVGNN